MAQRCARYKRVRSKFGGTVRRCASFSGRSSNGRRRKRGRYRRRAGMARKGSHCVRYKRVRVKGQGYAKRCAKFAGGRGRGRARSRYRKGRRPFNKGKKCVRYGTSSTGKRVCRSYGSRSGWRMKRGRRVPASVKRAYERSVRGGRYAEPASDVDLVGSSAVARAYQASLQAGRRWFGGGSRRPSMRVMG